MNSVWDVVVVGGGHAGCEAALAAARVGCQVLLAAGNLEMIGAMPCNCSIGGPAKAHLAREIDALGGEMGRNIDRTYTHIRMLNTRKGPAVQALRAQADKLLYRQQMKRALERAQSVQLTQQTVTGIDVPDRDGRPVVLWSQEGAQISGWRVVIATGTFLNGLIHIGRHSFGAGRAGEAPSVELVVQPHMARQGCSDASAMAQGADSGPIPRSSGPRSGVQGAHSGVSQARGRRSAVVLLGSLL